MRWINCDDGLRRKEARCVCPPRAKVVADRLDRVAVGVERNTGPIVDDHVASIPGTKLS
jgi:hypothetical protein